jgi:uncharacterized oxidoreductase
MPVFTIRTLHDLAVRILTAAGTPPDEAEVVAQELAEANAVGHDSHGVMRLMQYVDGIEKQFIRPGAAMELQIPAAAVTLMDAGFGFGQVAAAKALEAGMAQARESGTSTVMIRNCNHVGRLGACSDRAAKAGFASVMAVNAPGPGGVAPWGGIDRRLGTNPISMAAPWGDSAVVLDMTTSATAEGKLRVAYQKGESVPPGLIIDAQGQPTTDPATFYQEPGGALLPLGGPLGFKGYGLSVLIDIIGGMLSGSGIARTDLPRGANGVWMTFFHIPHFTDRATYDALMERYVAHLRSSRLAPGSTGILLPGEIEAQRRQERLTSGVPVPEETWRQITQLATRLSADLSDLRPE